MIPPTIFLDQAALVLAIGRVDPVFVPILTKPGVRRLHLLMHPVLGVPIWLGRAGTVAGLSARRRDRGSISAWGPA